MVVHSLRCVVEEIDFRLGEGGGLEAKKEKKWLSKALVLRFMTDCISIRDPLLDFSCPQRRTMTP